MEPCDTPHVIGAEGEKRVYILTEKDLFES